MEHSVYLSINILWWLSFVCTCCNVALFYRCVIEIIFILDSNLYGDGILIFVVFIILITSWWQAYKTSCVTHTTYMQVLCPRSLIKYYQILSHIMLYLWHICLYNGIYFSSIYPFRFRKNLTTTTDVEVICYWVSRLLLFVEVN